MNSFLCAAAHAADANDLVDRCLERLGSPPVEANVGFVYATDQLCDDLDRVLQRLQQRFPKVQWIGSVGVGICTTGREYYDEPALAVMLGAFPDDSFLLLPRIDGSALGPMKQLAGWRESQEYIFALLHGDPNNPMTPGMITQFADPLTNDFVNGGLTSSNSHNFQICNSVVTGGVSGVVFRHDVPIATDHTQGCSPIGPVHKLTESQRNIAIKLDGRPALDVMRRDIGEVLARDLMKVGGYIFAALPIPGSDTGDYLVRNLVGLDETKGLVAIGDDLEEQAQLMFCRRDGNTAREDMRRMLERLKKRTEGKSIRGGIYISCLGRGRYQFGENSEELKMIRDLLGDFSLVGFFANGEIYNGRVYGYTGVLTLFL